MKVESTELADVLLVTRVVRTDARGSFSEIWQRERYAEASLPTDWVQDNISRSARGVLRGLHFQHPMGQGKLVSAIEGAILDVAVDVRRGSPHFGRSVAVELSAESGRQLYIPPGFAHGFQVLSEYAAVHYKCTEIYAPAMERTLLWSDPVLAVDWRRGEHLLSAKDEAGQLLADFLPHELPAYMLPR